MRKFLLTLLIAIIGSIISTLVVDWIRGDTSLSTMYTILNFKVAVWLILVVVAVVALAIWIIKKIAKEKIPIEESPVFIDYTEDRFFEWKWSWKYRIFGNKFKVIRLNPHCPKCDIPMIEDFDMIECYRCPMCGYHTIQSENPDDIKHIINHRVEEMQK